MECEVILNLIAIVVIPIAAVLIGQRLQNRSEIRKDKMQIFKALMTSRIYGWFKTLMKHNLGKSKMHSTNCWKQYQNLLDIRIRLLLCQRSRKIRRGRNE